MGLSQIKIVVTAGFFVVIFVSGYWLYREGQPFTERMITVHKLFSLGMIVYLGKRMGSVLGSMHKSEFFPK